MNMKRILFLLCIAASGCLSTGCLVDAGKLAGFTDPKAKIKYRGLSAEVGTDFVGHMDGHYNAETKQIDLVVDVSSNASARVSAEGERADHIVELRRIETAYYLEAQKQVGKNFEAFGTMLAIAATAGGDAVAKVIDAAAPILKGSAITLPGGIGGTLGQPAPVEPTTAILPPIVTPAP